MELILTRIAKKKTYTIGKLSLTPDPNTVADGNPLPFVGPQPHSVDVLKTPVDPQGEGRGEVNWNCQLEVSIVWEKPMGKNTYFLPFLTSEVVTKSNKSVNLQINMD